MQIITTNEQLTALLPNIAVTVQGEVPLINKLTPFINAAEKWVFDTFTSATVFNTITSLPENNVLRDSVTQIVVYEAFRRALPHLDIILTPNGFGIVSNNNVAPASKERIAKLTVALLDNRDAAISQLLTSLSQKEDWLATTQAEFFRATMFPNASLAERFPRSSEGRWEQYLTLRLALMPIEEHIATHYLSDELMHNLRTQVQSGQFSTDKHKHICNVLQAVEVECIRNSTSTSLPPHNHRTLTHIVELIRTNPEDFPEWHSSPTAQLYNPPVFENKKDSKGFWF